MAIRWEIEVIDEVMLRKQVLKVETVDVTVDRTNFVLYLVYLFDHGPSLKMQSSRIVNDTLHALESRERCC